VVVSFLSDQPFLCDIGQSRGCHFVAPLHSFDICQHCPCSFGSKTNAGKWKSCAQRVTMGILTL